MRIKKSSWLWLKLTLVIGLSILAIVLLYIIIINFKVNYWSDKLEPKPYNTCTNFQYDLNTNYTKNEVKHLLENYIQPGAYIYKEQKLHCGATSNFQLRIIKVDNMTTTYLPYYTFALTHEFVHLKYYNGNECWTNYTAWKFLYESDNCFFHNVALWMANDITQTGGDCGWWILAYLGKNN